MLYLTQITISILVTRHRGLDPLANSYSVMSNTEFFRHFGTFNATKMKP